MTNKLWGQRSQHHALAPPWVDNMGGRVGGSAKVGELGSVRRKRFFDHPASWSGWGSNPRSPLKFWPFLYVV